MHLQDEGEPIRLAVVADPILDKVTNATYLLVLFEEEKSREPQETGTTQTFEIGEETRMRIQQLEAELQHTKESLQTTVEELETSNEELQASNEELLASNEELQSTNEELHSVNEELYSVNAEHEQKIKELNEVTSDLKNLIQATDIGIIFTDAEHRIRLFTPRAADVLNLLPQDIGRDIKHITSQIKDDDILEDIRRAALTRERQEKKVTTPDGHSYLRSITTYLNINREPAGLVIYFVDVTALDAAERQFRLMIESAPQAVLMVDGEGVLAHFNAAAEESFGYQRSEVLGKKLEILLPERHRAGHVRLRAGFAENPVARTMSGRELTGLRKNGTEFPIEVGLSPVELKGRHYVVAFITDITNRQQMQLERERIERKMTETQKLESLGVLAGGIAHDFNNLLAGIIGNNSLALLDLPDDSPAREFLVAIRESAERAAELCKQMLAYSGRGRFVVERSDLSRLVEETTHLLQVSISKKVSLRFQLSRELPCVVVDAVQIRQVIMNLVINASEAIGDHPGVINVTTGFAKVDHQDLVRAFNHVELPEGQYVYLEVSDTGSGIKPEDMNRIFEPFFTTKFTGRGLGLSAVLGIVRGHKGAISVSSELGTGTTFKLLLPPSPNHGESPEAKSKEDPTWRGSGKVLLVDDEEMVRNSVRRMLQALGFEVVVATDGREGVEIFAESPEQYTLVLLDLTMPHLDGAQAFARMRQLDAQARVLLMSGFNEPEASAGFAGEGLAGFVQKPFDVETLRRSLRQIFTTPPANN